MDFNTWIYIYGLLTGGFASIVLVRIWTTYYKKRTIHKEEEFRKLNYTDKEKKHLQTILDQNKDKEIRRLKVDNESYADEQFTLQEKVRELQNDIKKKDKGIKSLEKLNDEWRDKLSNSGAEINRLKKRNGEWQDKLSNAFAEIERLKQVIKELKSNTTFATFKKENGDLRKEIERLLEQLKTASKRQAPIPNDVFEKEYMPKIFKMIQQGYEYIDIERHFKWRAGYLVSKLNNYRHFERRIKKARQEYAKKTNKKV